MPVEQFESILPNNPQDLDKIKAAIHEVSGSMFRIESEKDNIKAIFETLSENFPDVDKKLMRQVAMAYHKSNKDQTIAQATQFEIAYNKIFGITEEDE